MTYQTFNSTLSHNYVSHLHSYRNRHSIDKIFNVTVHGEDGETEDFEITASSESEAMNKAYGYTTIIDIQYATVYE